MTDDLLIARNPDPESGLPYLLRLPLASGMVFSTSDTWPRTKALYCYPLTADDWPVEPDIVERAPVRSCARRGAAIDLVLDRGRENRSTSIPVVSTSSTADPACRQRPQSPYAARPEARARGIS